MARSTAGRSAARFKQLSCLGLAKEVVVPALLGELHSLIPSFSNTFRFADETGRRVANIYFENNDFVEIFPFYQQEILEHRDRQFQGLPFSEGSLLVGAHEFQNLLIDNKTFHRSDVYNLVLRPVGHDSNFLRIYFRDGGRVLGSLTLWRTPGAGIWSLEEKLRLASLETFFVQALTAPNNRGHPFVDSGSSGLIVATTAGMPVHFSAQGRKLLFLAANPRNGQAPMIKLSSALPGPVAQLCIRLSRIFSDDASPPAPLYRHSNVWGDFTFRAQWLDQSAPGSELIGIIVTHNVPLPLKLTQNVQRLPLSRRQAEVCVLMATGASNEEIADRLDISRHTAKEHGRWIYNKLNVHNRTELVSKILST